MNTFRLILFISLLSPVSFFAQRSSGTNDSLQVDSLIKKANELRGNDHKYREALAVIDSALGLSQQTKYFKGQGNALVQKGRILKGQERYEEAEEIYFEALDIRQQLGDFCGVASIYNNLSSIAETAEIALDYSQKAVKLGDSSGCDNIPYFLFTLANVYEEQDSLDSAFAVCRRGISVAKEKKDIKALRIGYYGLAKRCYQKKEYKNGIPYLDSALVYSSYKKEYATDMLAGQIYELIGVMSLNLKDFETSIQRFNSALERIEQYPQAQEAIANIHFNIADYYAEKHRYESAKTYFEKGKMLLREGSDFYERIDVSINLMDALIEKKKSDMYFTMLLLALILVGFSVAVLSLLLFRKEKQRAHFERETNKLKHDIVKNGLVVIENILKQDLGKYSSAHPFYIKMWDIRNQIYTILEQIGFGNKITEDRQDIPLLKPFARQMHRKAEMASMMKVEDYSFLDEVENYALSQNLRTELEHIITEIFINIKKHANCSLASIAFDVDENGLSIVIEDNGEGFDVHRLSTSSLGLKNIRDRVKALKGRMEIHSSPANGTSITIVIAQFPEF